MRTIRPALVIAVLTVVIPIADEAAWACSCAVTTREERADHADVVFTGRVRSVLDDGTQVVATFRVSRVYKGGVRRRVEVSTASQESTCGCSFRRGKRYTVFADRSAKRGLSTSLCSGTKRGGINAERYGLPRGHRP